MAHTRVSRLEPNDYAIFQLRRLNLRTLRLLKFNLKIVHPHGAKTLHGALGLFGGYRDFFRPRRREKFLVLQFRNHEAC